MTKQLQKLILLAVAAFSYVNGHAYDLEFAKIDGIYYNLNTTTKSAHVTYNESDKYSYNSYSGNVVIPASITYKGNTYSVVSIYDDAFRNCDLDSITIPESVRSIGSCAFYSCRVRTIRISAFVKSIGRSAFKGCSATIYLYAKLTDYLCLQEYPSEGKVNAFSSEIQAIRKVWSGKNIHCLVSVHPSITLQNISSTSISVKGSYYGTVPGLKTGFIYHGPGDTLTLKGLRPNQEYEVEYYLTNSRFSEVVRKKFTTEELQLTTLQPRCVSSTCAVVAAETNISDDETNVGFQWKKYDAPESLKPSEGYAAIYGGQLEGYIRNLQPTSYYNVRAFYKSAEGDYYYGDWVTFDPSDFSYFEPTVHTYAADDVTHSSARVRGYVLAGTDDIEEQGFEYWPVSTTAANALRVKASVTDAADGVQTVLATGQVMTVELRNLRPGTTYCCRAFVKTATRTTYGEKQTFTTEGDPTGIDDITIDTPAAMPTVTGYYDLGGRKSDTPHHGVNIVRYSDGTARKVIMK